MQEFIIEVLKWLGGGGVALLGLWLTKKKDKNQDKYNIINELQEENKRKDDRLDKQDEKIQYLVDQMDEMRKEMFAIQSDKHKSEVKNVELKSKNESLARENQEMTDRLYKMEMQKDKLITQLEEELKNVRNELNQRIDRLIKENEELRKVVLGINNKKNND